jgi:hypothetical protein
MRRKGELSPAGIDRGWPHQVALPGRLCERGGYNEIHEFEPAAVRRPRADAERNRVRLLETSKPLLQKRDLPPASMRSHAPLGSGPGLSTAISPPATRWSRRSTATRPSSLSQPPTASRRRILR